MTTLYKALKQIKKELTRTHLVIDDQIEKAGTMLWNDREKIKKEEFFGALNILNHLVRYCDAERLSLARIKILLGVLDEAYEFKEKKSSKKENAKEGIKKKN